MQAKYCHLSYANKSLVNGYESGKVLDGLNVNCKDPSLLDLNERQKMS
jgi:hypothetical protein